MQLSLVSELPEFEKKVFLDVFAQVYFDNRRNKLRLKTIDGQLIPSELQVGCATQVLTKFPEGTIYKLDARLVKKSGKKPYFIAIKRKNVERAIEFFDHNLKLQCSGESTTSKITKLKTPKKQKKEKELVPF